MLHRALETAGRAPPEYEPPIESFLIYSKTNVGRGILANTAKNLGATRVRFVSKESDLVAAIENGAYSLVLLDEDASAYQAHHILDEIRRSGLLDIQTIVVIISGEPTYQKVVEAAENGADIFLARPFSYGALVSRLETVLTRRHEMREVYAALARKDWDGALQLCLERYQWRQPFWLFAARVAAEILLAKGQAAQAQEIYEAIVAEQALPWARLGIARAMVERGQVDRAAERAEELAGPETVDAYDILGRAHLEAGRAEQALQAFALAVQATRKSHGRLQRLGLMQMLLGFPRDAAHSFRDSIRYGIKSQSFEPIVFFWLAHLYRTIGTAADWMWLQERLKEARKYGHSVSLLDDSQLMYDFLRLRRDSASAVGTGVMRRQIEPLLDRAFDDDTTFDRACMVLYALADLAAHHQDRIDDETIIDHIAQRFSVSRLATEWLCFACRAYPSYAERVRERGEHVGRMAREIAKDLLGSDPQKAAHQMIDLVQHTRNPRVAETVFKLLERHQAKLDNGDAIMAQIRSWVDRLDIEAARRMPGFRYLRHPGGVALLARAAEKPEQENTTTDSN
jgi:DNA-binding response OmpR family regulator